MKKIISVFLIIIMTFTLFPACGRDDSVVLFYAVNDIAGSFDPQIASGDTTRLIVRNCFEGLVSLSPDGSVGEGVAERWEVSDDGLTYTFYLRPDAVWHVTSNALEQLEGKLPEDFAPHVTAQDFVFALRRAVDPAVKSPDAYLLMNIAGAQLIGKGKGKLSSLGVRAINDTTLEIKLEKPQSNFPEVLTCPAAMPCNEQFFNACTGRYGTYIRFLLSDGPFYLSRFDETSYRINKSPDYVGVRTPKADAVWLYQTDDRKTLLEELADSEYSGAVISEAEKESMKASSDFTFTPAENIVRGIIFNTKDELLSCGDLRRAFAAATNASLIAANAGKEYSGSFIPGSAASPLVTEHPVMYNEKNAAVYLEKAYKSLDTGSVTLSVLCEARHEELMRKLLQEWQRILGISVVLSVQPVSPETLAQAVAKGEYQIAFSPVETQTDSPFEAFGTYTPARADSVTGYSNAAVTKLLSELYGGDDKHFASVYRELEQKLSDAAVLIPVWGENSYLAETKGVSGTVFGAGRDRLRLADAVSE